MHGNPLQVICMCVCLLMVQTRTLRVEIPAIERIFSMAIETLRLVVLDANQCLSIILHHILPVFVSYFYQFIHIYLDIKYQMNLVSGKDSRTYAFDQTMHGKQAIHEK